jgi:hypothetical protein
VLIPEAIRQTHIKSNIQHMEGQSLKILADGRVKLMNHNQVSEFIAFDIFMV